MNNIPVAIQTRVDTFGFEITGWDEVRGSITGHGQHFLGSHGEIIAYLDAWAACSSGIALAVEKARSENERGIIYHALSLVGNLRDQHEPTIQIRALPQRPYRIERLVLSAACAPAYSVLDLCVGNKSTMLQAGELPGEAFAANLDHIARLVIGTDDRLVTIHIDRPAYGALGGAVLPETCQLAMDVALTVRCKEAKVPLEAFVLGYCATY